ncbi:MAG: T9SS type A sorting domain-containing protein [Cyclobacteriaceae bacterium]|nr:T9SS type A sorting domain-containing protein [Cyclobacteriaceae bacterium]
MKTKSLMLAALVVFSALTTLAKDDPNNTGLFVISGKSGVYKLIYEGEKPSALTLTIFDNQGKVVYAETVRNLKGFIRPVNFKGMASGTYIIQVKNGDQKMEAVVEYAPQVAKAEVSAKKAAVHAKVIEANKFAIMIANQGKETVEVRIFDAQQDLVNSYRETVTGSYGKVFNLSKVESNSFTFEVYTSAGLIDRIKF